MKEIFTSTLKGVSFDFERVFYGNDDLFYHISFNNKGKTETFRMKRDDEGIWKIQAQVLPIWIHEMELDFNDVIKENETKI